jgi:drug/metabolite transporter (DMT)-like permease
MTAESNAIAIGPVTARRLPAGLALGALGVLAFSFTLPATKLAVSGGLDGPFVGVGRSVVAGLLAAAYLVAVRAPVPSRAQWRSLAIVGLGVVLGFPVLTALALEVEATANAAVVVALLPAGTAIAAVLRAGERPTGRFWLAAGMGSAATVAFVLTRGVGGLHAADALLLGAVVLCALGYAEGGALARDLGGARTICWALVGLLPLTTAVTLALAAPHGTATAWAGFAYVAVVSMFLGFFAWYAGLARGGVARVGQVQLAQPVLTLGWAALVLGERVTPPTAAAALVVLACVAATQRAR